MTSVLRRPLAPRQPESWSNKQVSPVGQPLRQTTSSSSNKRPHSPDVSDLNNAKRAKATLHTLVSITAAAGEADEWLTTHNPASITKRARTSVQHPLALVSAEAGDVSTQSPTPKATSAAKRAKASLQDSLTFVTADADAQPATQKPTSTAKRTKTSHEHALAFGDTAAGEAGVQSATHSPTTVREGKERKDKLRQREDREQAHKLFVARYKEAFPKFVFYFDDRDNNKHTESKVVALGATIELFFSASVTHVITNCSQPPKNEQVGVSNKENAAPSRSGHKESVLRSPIQLKTRAHDHGSYDKLIRDAVQLHKKIWSVSKLENILSRLLPNDASKEKARRSTQLNQLLHHERVHGTTSERDPFERRHDYQYFSKNSHFFLVEDIRGELAPIAIVEYPVPPRSLEKDQEPAYPTLHLDHRVRSPFVKYDDKEARRQEKAERTERAKDRERERIRKKVKHELQLEHEKQIKTKSLRRSASMSQLGRKVFTRADFEVDEYGEAAALSNSLGLWGDVTLHEQVASGFGQSATGMSTGNGYLAASGNSVPLTSTNTTSITLPGSAGNLRLPQNLRERIARQVVTNKRRLEGMGESRLRKAKSTNTMQLPAREESKKPGYCEACRTKFEDFKGHVNGSRHRKFAVNENNYVDLDFLLCRLERKPIDDYCESESPESDAKLKHENSDACLGPGDYFYVSPKREDDWDDEETGEDVPQIVIDEDIE